MGRVRLLPVMLSVVVTLSACTGNDSDGIAVSVAPGKPLLVTAPPVPDEFGRDVEITVREGGLLDILTWGSGSCPYVPADIERLATDAVRVVMEKRSNGDREVCSADLGPTVATVQLPERVAYRDPFRLVLQGVGPERELGARLGFTNGGGDSIQTPDVG